MIANVERLEREHAEVISEPRSGDASVEGVVVCRFAVPDQHGTPVCMKNPEAPGDCNLDACPYGGPWPKA